MNKSIIIKTVTSKKTGESTEVYLINDNLDLPDYTPDQSKAWRFQKVLQMHMPAVSLQNILLRERTVPLPLDDETTHGRIARAWVFFFIELPNPLLVPRCIQHP